MTSDPESAHVVRRAMRGRAIPRRDCMMARTHESRDEAQKIAGKDPDFHAVRFGNEAFVVAIAEHATGRAASTVSRLDPPAPTRRPDA
jgi:hypothetical protein